MEALSIAYMWPYARHCKQFYSFINATSQSIQTIQAQKHQLKSTEMKISAFSGCSFVPGANIYKNWTGCLCGRKVVPFLSLSQIIPMPDQRQTRAAGIAPLARPGRTGRQRAGEKAEAGFGMHCALCQLLCKAVQWWIRLQLTLRTAIPVWWTRRKVVCRGGTHY